MPNPLTVLELEAQIAEWRDELAKCGQTKELESRRRALKQWIRAWGTVLKVKKQKVFKPTRAYNGGEAI
jgi:hypothetical protein